jgi:hypothetical protein
MHLQTAEIHTIHEVEEVELFILREELGEENKPGRQTAFDGQPFPGCHTLQ